MNKKRKLFPCPFCGGEVSVARCGDDVECYYFITRGHNKNACKCRLFMEGEKFDKYSSPKEYARYKQELIKTWNRRANVVQI